MVYFPDDSSFVTSTPISGTQSNTPENIDIQTSSDVSLISHDVSGSTADVRQFTTGSISPVSVVTSNQVTTKGFQPSVTKPATRQLSKYSTTNMPVTTSRPPPGKDITDEYCKFNFKKLAIGSFK